MIEWRAWKLIVLVYFFDITGAMNSSIAAEVVAPPSLRHNLQVTIIPNQNHLRATDRIEVTGADTLRFTLADELTINQVHLDGNPVSIQATDGQWYIDLGKPGPHELEISYSGSFLPKKQTDRSSHTSNLSGPIIAPEASYLPAGSGWYPEFETGHFTYELMVSLPSPQKAVVPGLLVHETENHDKGGYYQARFTFNDPAWGIPLFAGPYQVREHHHGAYRLRTYFFEEMEPLSADYLALSKDYLDQFSARIGQYPFDSFYIIAARLPVGLGFPGITYIGEHVLKLPFIKYSSLGHEFLHNWWGNGVYVDYANGNWAEGLTTYLADYSFLEQTSSAMALVRRLEWLQDYAALPPERDRPSRTFTSKTHKASQVIGYNKVAFLFHMLRRQLGEDVFESSLRRFWREQRFQIAGWDELEDAFSDEAGKDLSVFFSQWLDRTGALDISFGKVEKRREEQNKWHLSFEIKQSEPSYQLQVPLTILTAKGPVERLIPIKGTDTKVEIQLSSEPMALVADPDFHLFRRLGSGEAPPILRDTLLHGQTQTLVLGDEAFQQKAMELAHAMLDSSLQPNNTLEPGKPFLLIGLSPSVDTFLHTHELPGVPDELTVKSSAQVWALRTPQGQPYVIISADTLASLEALFRPLPHYGRRGYMAFEGSKAVVKGNWPLSNSGIIYRFDPH
ncbi:peptidase M1 [Photobacterium gaetbulicola]|uniref:Putative peptidase M1, membrane alanine aminopeptidase n=1 Tax=Photobacterium gaetbulicola Gung47 TaxID=658445 RepID=A0A0C5WS04_9GAMM|nr:M1 family aminopeptidase [Photobacterium gaetbulicola]AJR07864.1 putative peptidase M1, membrane alanine aminopeptidase [Photobacterium gaetbulicola Gung47]PSU03186.1 peptidase M1 [Photobacterium gaetbulicola]